MARSDIHHVNQSLVRYDNSVVRTSLHSYTNIKARTKLFHKAGPAFRGFQYDEFYNLRHTRLLYFIEPLDNEEKQLEKDVFTIFGHSCVRCTLTFSSKDHLKAHIFFCGNPTIVAGDPEALKIHRELLQSQDGGMLFCPWCPLLCLNTVVLFKHVEDCREARRERIQRKILNRLPCPECSLDFSHLQKLCNHMQSHYVADFTCNACNFSFASANILSNHIAQCKRGRKKLQCCDCNRIFRKVKSLQNHVLDCRRSVQCLKCAEFFPGRTLCVEHIVKHILSEWTKTGLQLIDGVLYRILRHKLPDDKVSQRSLSPISPCSSPTSDWEKSSEKYDEAFNSKADPRPEPSRELNIGLNKAPPTLFEKSLQFARQAKTSDPPHSSHSSDESDPIFAPDQSQEKELVAGASSVPNYILRAGTVTNSINSTDAPPLNTSVFDEDEDTLSGIENEEYEIEHTLEEEELLLEPEICGSDTSLPAVGFGENCRNAFKTTTENQLNQSDVAQLFTPAIDTESEDSNKLTLTVVNVEGGANLFDWDDCAAEEDICGVNEVGEPQEEIYGTSLPPEEIGDGLVGPGSHSDGNEDEDSGIGATDDSDSNKDRSEALHKCGDVSAKMPISSAVSVKDTENPCLDVLSEIFVSSSLCDSEVVIESSPIESMVIPKSYSILAEHSYTMPYTLALTADATFAAKAALGAEKKQEKLLKINTPEGINMKLQKHRRKNKIPEKKRPGAVDTSIIEQDPLQNILAVMSKEARQTFMKKSNSGKHSSVSKKSTLITSQHCHPNKSITVPQNNVLSKSGDNPSVNYVKPTYENHTAREYSSAHPQMIDNPGRQSVIMSSGSVEASPVGGAHINMQEDLVTQLDVPEIVSARPPSACISQRLTRDDFIERAKPPMSLNKMLKMERSLLKHGFKQIATVLPQRKESLGMKEPSIGDNSVAERSVLHMKALKETQSPALVTMKPNPSDILLNEVVSTHSANNSNFVPNVFYIQLPPGLKLVSTSAPEHFTSVVPNIAQSNVVFGRLPNTLRTVNTNSNYQSQDHPSDVVSALVNLGSDVSNQSTSSSKETPQLSGSGISNQLTSSSKEAPQLPLQLETNAAITTEPVSSLLKNTFSKSKNMVSVITLNDNSGTNSQPVFATVLPSSKTASTGNFLDSPGTSLPNVQLSEKTLLKEIFPPVQESAHLPVNEPEMNKEQESMMLEMSIPLESDYLLDMFGNSRTNMEDMPPLAVSKLLDGSSKSLPYSQPNLNFQSSDETICNVENVLPVQEISHFPTNEPEDKLEGTLLQKDTPEPEDKLEGTLLQKDTPEPEDKLEGTLLQKDTPVQTAVTISPLVQCTSKVLPNEPEHKLGEESSILNFDGNNITNDDDHVTTITSSNVSCSTFIQEDTEKISETEPVKASPLITNKCTLVNDDVKQIEGKNYSETMSPEVKPISFHEDDFDEDTFDGDISTLDHEIDALISCLDSNIAGEESSNLKGDNDSRNEVPFKENLKTTLSKNGTDEATKIKTIFKGTKTQLVRNWSHSQPFKVCQMQLFNSKDEELMPVEAKMVGGKPVEESSHGNVSESKKKNSKCISHFRTNTYASRKLMSEMKMLKRPKPGREGLHQRNSVSTYNCNNCSQWFYSQSNLEAHNCLKALIRGKFTSEQFDRLIDREEQSECTKDLVQVGDGQLTPNSGLTNLSSCASHLIMKTNLGYKKFICEKCHIRCKSLSALLEHKSIVHGEKYSVECHICGKNFPRLQQLAVHMAKSHRVERIPSLETPKLPVKNQVVKPLEEKALHVTDMGESTKNEGSKEGTSVSIGSANPDPSQCSICGKSFKGKVGLTSHMVQAHRETARENTQENASPSLEDDITQCSICKKLFKGKGGLTSHMNQAHRETFKCPLCSRRFCYVQTLKYHLANHHASSLNTEALLLESEDDKNCESDQVNSTLMSENLSPQGRKLKKSKKTKWKFVKVTSPERAHSEEQPCENISGALDNDVFKIQGDNTSPKENSKKPKKVKWRIVKDTSPEKTLGPDRPAKSPRISDEHPEQVPPLVISLSKVKKRHKCRICYKHYKKYQHLVQHQLEAHKFRFKPKSKDNQSKISNEDLAATASPENQQSQTAMTTPNCPAEVALLIETDVDHAENKVGENVHENLQPSSESNVAATVETNTDCGQRNLEEQTNCPDPADALIKEDIRSSSPLKTPMEEQVTSPIQQDLQSDKFECKMCQIQFSAKGYFERHNIKSHGAPCEFGCSLCTKFFVDKRSLKLHIKLKHSHHMGEKITPLPLNSNDERRRTQKKKRERKCEQCDKKFRRDIDLKKHKRRDHKTSHRFKCSLCGLYFLTKPLLTSHKFEIHGEGSVGKLPDSSTNPNKRNDTNQESQKDGDEDIQNTAQEGMMELEKNSDNPEDETKIFKCPDCSLTYKTVSCLKRHRISMHADEACHYCDVCGKGFSYPHSLKNHMYLHSCNAPETPRKSNRSARKRRKRMISEDSDEPGPNREESDVKKDESTPATIETDPSVPASETIATSKVSDCNSSNSNKLEEKTTEKEIIKEKLEEDVAANAVPQDEDLQHRQTPSPQENLSHHDYGSVAVTDNPVPVTFNSASPVNSSAPVENYSSHDSYMQNDMSTMSSDEVRPNSDINDHQWRMTQQMSQYQLPSTLQLPSPTVPPFPEPPVTQAFNTCTLCGLCLPNWYALQEHHYMFHSYPNYYVGPPPPAPTPYPAPLEYPVYTNQNAAYSDWTPQQHQLTNISQSTVFNNGAASFQELTSPSGAQCSVCGLGFPSLYALQEHYATHMATAQPAMQFHGGFY